MHLHDRLFITPPSRHVALVRSARGARRTDHCGPAARAPACARCRRAGRAVALRPRSQGLSRHLAHDRVEGLVHRRRWRAQRCVLPDDRQHQRRDAAIHRDRWVDLHRSANPRHGVDRDRRSTTAACRAASPARQTVASTRSSPTTSPTPIATRCSCAHASIARTTIANLKLYVRFDPTVNGNGGGGDGNGGADSAVTDTSTHHPIPVAFDTVTATNAANRDYAQPVFAALDGPFAKVTSGYAGAEPATA